MLNWVGGAGREVKFLSQKAFRVAFLHVVLTLALSQGNHAPSEALNLLINELGELHHATHFCRECSRQTSLIFLKSKCLRGFYLDFWVFPGQSRPGVFPSAFKMNDDSKARGGGVGKKKHTPTCLL